MNQHEVRGGQHTSLQQQLGGFSQALGFSVCSKELSKRKRGRLVNPRYSAFPPFGHSSIRLYPEIWFQVSRRLVALAQFANKAPKLLSPKTLRLPRTLNPDSETHRKSSETLMVGSPPP